jgi:SAM-dependent methyltransferase
LVDAPRLRPAAVRGPRTSPDACTVCGSAERITILTAEAIAHQLAWLESFHERRLRTAARDRRRSALEDRARFTQDDPRAIVGCRACGLVFRHPQRAAVAVERDYAADRYGVTRLETLFASQVAAYDAKIAMLAGLGERRRPRVLEVGSFVGGFLAAAGARGWDVRGVDPGEEVVAFCRTRGLAVERGTLEDVALAPASLDAVVVWNTFDQIAKPRPTLAAAARAVRAGGLLALRVPNGRYFADAIARLGHDGELRRRYRLLALAWNNLIGFPYLHGYSVGTLDRLVAPYGFERVVAVPDALLPLADADTRPWAALEERMVKTACRVGWTRQIPGPARLAAAPWLDVYYRWLNGSAR